MSQLLSSHGRDLAGRAPVGALALTTTPMRLAIGLIVTAIVVLALTNPSGAQTTASVMRNMTVAAPQQHDHFAQCMQDWDAATHMTKQEWRHVCRRLLLQRRGQLDKLGPGNAVSAPK
jgi:hypothetical protein